MNKNTNKPLRPYDLWPSGKPLRFVNAEQFNPTELINKLGWSGIADSPTSDSKSIKVRQDGLKLFSENIALSDVVRSGLPSDNYWSKRFFESYGSKSDFNLKTNDFIEELKKSIETSPVSADSIYRKIIADLEVEKKKVAQLEDNITDKLKVELEKIYSYNGVVFIESNLDGDKFNFKSDSYGVQDYSFHSEEPLLIEICRNINELYGESNAKKWKYVGVWTLRIILLPLLLITLLVASFADKNRNDSMYTKEIPVSVKDQLTMIHEHFKNLVREKLIENPLTMNRIDYFSKSISIATEFQFNLTPESGFIVRLIDISYKINVPNEYISTFNSDWGNPFAFEERLFTKGVSIYSIMKSFVFRKRARKLANKAAEKFVKLPLMQALESALLSAKDLLNKGSEFVTEGSYDSMLSEVKYSRVRDAIEGLQLKDDWNVILDYRNKIRCLNEDLQKISAKSTVIRIAREKYKDFPMTFPTILDDSKNVVSFKNLAPLHLIGRKNKSQTKNLGVEDLKLITGLPALNGQIISITGQNGGGKTVIETELIYALYLAHMGFPVFAENFTFNAKDCIAMVFVEKGEGSMLQLIMQKLKAVAEEVEKSENNKIVVILDELLTGTQEEVGLDIGREYLRMLSRKKCSVMFVTQITQLAEFAHNELNALCFHFDKNGDMQKGIGKGNARILAEEVGLDKYLS